MIADVQSDQYLDTVLGAISRGTGHETVLDALPVPIYMTDAEGTVTYWNQACAEFAGREPQPGDKWCVTWEIYTTTGDYLPHDKCPMADAIRNQREVRGAVAIARRPDGSRRAFRPYPTPLFDADGRLSGAVNMLIDVTHQQSSALDEQAERCRRLAGAFYNRETSSALGAMADSFSRTAEELRTNKTP